MDVRAITDQESYLSALKKELSNSRGFHCSSECVYVFGRTRETAGMRGEGKGKHLTLMALDSGSTLACS